MGIFQKHNVIKVDGKAIPKWLKAKLCQSQNYRKSWYVWDILNTCIWIFNIENKCHSIFMKNLLVLNAAHLLLIAMVYTFYFLSIFNSCWTLKQLQCLTGAYGFFHIIIFFLHFMFSKASTDHSSEHMRVDTLCCQYFQMQAISLVCTAQDEYGASLCYLMWLSSESFRAWLCLQCPENTGRIF